ncbi:MAG: hypothetical protein SNJ83_10095 [Aggregatilineales bacterium]
MKKIPTAVILMIVLLALVGVATWQSLPSATGQATRTPTPDPRDVQTVFRHITTETIQALRIDDPLSSRDLILEANGSGGWRLIGVADPNALDPIVAENIAKTVAFIPYVEVLPPSNDLNLVNYGLTSETFWLQIQVILTSMETRNIVVGNLAPGTQSGYYALVDDRPEIYILNRGAVEYLAGYLRQVQPFLPS